jgi:hypothetical protein
MVLRHLVPLHCVVEVFDLLDDDRRAMPRAVTPDGRAIASVPSMMIGSGIPCRSGKAPWPFGIKNMYQNYLSDIIISLIEGDFRHL